MGWISVEPDAKTGTWIPPKIKDDFPGVKGQADFADKAFSAGQTRRRDDRLFPLRAKVVNVNAVVDAEPVGLGAVVYVGVIMVGGIRLAFYENNLIESKLAGQRAVGNCRSSRTEQDRN